MGIITDYRLLNKNRYKLSKQAIEALQLKALKAIYHKAISDSPFYQKLYKGYPFETLDDFYKLPTINKSIMMENFSDLNTVGLNKEAVMAYAVEKELNKDYLGYYQDEFVIGLSSGTSGNKGLYITPKSLTKRLPGVFLARGGISLKDLPLRIMFCLRVFSQGFSDINAPFLKLKYTSTMTPIEKFIQDLNQVNTNLLMAPPSFIRQLLPYKNQIKVKLKKIITYAEVLNDADKAQFELYFKTKVIEIYQASEGQIASACKAGHLHINEDLVFVELYDENNKLITEPNVVGHKMILTNLVNDAQPLIRYEMNDMIVLDEPCSCGSHFRRIKRIIGRCDDNLYFYDQQHQKQVVYSDLFSRWIITTSDDIREFQVKQVEVGKLEITLDVQHTFETSLIKDRLDKELGAIGLVGTYTFKVEKLALPKHLNKFKRFISTIDEK